MRIVVTGGAGFIGSHVVQRLLRLGHEVSIVDDLNDFYNPELKRRNLEEIAATGPVRFFHCNICDRGAFTEALSSAGPDAVIHLAARAGVRPSLDDPLLYEHVNVRGTLIVLEACRAAGVKRLIFASSSSIYGDANRVPFSEDDSVQLPLSPYAATKIAGEKLCYTWSHLYGLGCVCLRFFTVYGPRQRPDLAIRKFTEMIWRDEPIPVFGDGSGGRDYTYIDDIVAGVIAALTYNCRYEVFNLGNSRPIALPVLIGTIENCLGRRAVIRSLPHQPGDVHVTCADISKARRLLGYSPDTPFESGIAKFVAWYLRHAPASPTLRAHV